MALSTSAQIFLQTFGLLSTCKQTFRVLKWSFLKSPSKVKIFHIEETSFLFLFFFLACPACNIVFCVRGLFSQLYLLKQQWVNGRHNQNNTSLNLSHRTFGQGPQMAFCFVFFNFLFLFLTLYSSVIFRHNSTSLSVHTASCPSKPQKSSTKWLRAVYIGCSKETSVDAAVAGILF